MAAERPKAEAKADPKAQPKAQPKRQARGQQRIAQLLDAAAEVFGEVGYAAATTNAIAARAGASPGTLYQFFRNKEAVARALVNRYLEVLNQAQSQALRPDLARLPLDRMLDHIVDPMIAFDRENPGFHALLADPGVTPEIADAKKPLQEKLLERIDAILAARAPDLPEERRRRGGAVAVHIFRGLLPLIMAAAPEELPQVSAEVKRALHGYLAPLLGE